MSIIAFGEKRPEFAVPVLNERAVRASAGILFLFAMIAFMNAWLIGNFQPTRVFVVAFLVDFSIRIFVNPRYAPSLVLGQWMVRRQQPEWVGAPQKRFAWAIGLALAVAMFFLMVVNSVVGPINLLVCGTCLALLFFEASFGICVGCWIYNRLNKEAAQLCPGGVCEAPVAPVRTSPAQAAVLVLFAAATVGLAPHVAGPGPVSIASRADPAAAPPSASEIERCKVPHFAKAMGHEEKWKLHNNCP